LMAEATDSKWPRWSDLSVPDAPKSKKDGTDRQKISIKTEIARSLDFSKYKNLRAFLRIEGNAESDPVEVVVTLTKIFREDATNVYTQRPQDVKLSDVYVHRKYVQAVRKYVKKKSDEYFGSGSVESGVFELFDVPAGGDNAAGCTEFEMKPVTSFDAFCFYLVFWGFLPEVVHTSDNVQETSDRIRLAVKTDIWSKRPWAESSDPEGTQYADIKEFFRGLLFPANQDAATVMYLCERQMFSLCKALKWSDEELLPEWFKRRWLLATGLGYAATSPPKKAEDMTSCYRKVIKDNLWLAAAQGMLRFCGVCGFEGTTTPHSQKACLPPWDSQYDNSGKLVDILSDTENKKNPIRKLAENDLAVLTDSTQLQAYCKPLAAAKPSDLNKVQWPYWLCKVWESVGHTHDAGNSPTLLNSDQLYNFFMKVVYIDSHNFVQEDGSSPDVASFKVLEGDFKTLVPGKGKTLEVFHDIDITVKESLVWFNPQIDQLYASRGITLDVWRKMTDGLNTINNSDMYFFECLVSQNKALLGDVLKITGASSVAKQRAGAASKPTNFNWTDLQNTKQCFGMLGHGLFGAIQLKYLGVWMTQDTKDTRITQQSFQTFVREAKLGIPADKVDEIFNGIVKCQNETPADDSAAPGADASASTSARGVDSTISYADCNNALRTYNSGGLWKDGVTELIKMAFPCGALKEMALHNVSDAFDQFDADGSGTIAPTEVGSLLMTLLTPGVPLDVFEDLVADSSKLGFSIPRATIHELTDLVDANHDGFLQAPEFVALLMAVVHSDVPQRVMSRLNVTPWQIGKVVLQSVFTLICLFVMITLVIQSFTSGQGLAQLVQTASSSASVLYVKSQENTSMAKEEARLIAWAKEKVTEELAQALNITSQAVQASKDKAAGPAKPDAPAA